MFHVIYTEGINQPRVLGNYSVLESAKQMIRDRIKKLGGGWEPTFIEQEDQWIAIGPDQTYIIQSGAELPAHKQ